MESNGVKGKIQVSEATANLLIEGGKGHWVEPREDKITAKGKGEMQTYWVNVKKSSSPYTNVTSNASTLSQGSCSLGNIEDFTETEFAPDVPSSEDDPELAPDNVSENMEPETATSNVTKSAPWQFL